MISEHCGDARNAEGSLQIATSRISAFATRERASRREESARDRTFPRIRTPGEALRACRVVPEKTRIAFQVRMSFAAVTLRRDRIVGHIVLARHSENPRFTKIEYISPRNHVHSFCFQSREELDREVLSWVREAYRVGQQRHLSK